MLKHINSDNVTSCLSATNLTSVHADPPDPFVPTLHTSRNERKSKIERMLAPALSPEYTLAKYRRGYKHTPGYGNFSNFNSILKNNEAGTIKRWSCLGSKEMPGMKEWKLFSLVCWFYELSGSFWSAFSELCIVSCFQCFLVSFPAGMFCYFPLLITVKII